MERNAVLLLVPEHAALGAMWIAQVVLAQEPSAARCYSWQATSGPSPGFGLWRVQDSGHTSPASPQV